MRKGIFAICSVLLVLVVSIAVLVPSCEPVQCTIEVKANLDGSPWSGAVQYTLTGPSIIAGAAVENSFALECGTWACNYTSGGPSGAYLDSITPSPTQSVSNGGTITFTLNFKTGAKFVAHFMTPEGEPYPFDVIISDGTWRKEWNYEAYIETEVPADAECTYSLYWSNEYCEACDNFKLSFSPGEIREFDFYLVTPEDIFGTPRPYVLFEERDANLTFSYEYSGEDKTLQIDITNMTKGSYVNLLVPCFDPSFEEYAIAKWYINGESAELFAERCNLICGSAETVHQTETWVGGKKCDNLKLHNICIFGHESWWFSPFEINLSFRFEEMEPTLGSLTVVDVLRNDRLFCFNATLTSLGDPLIGYEAVCHTRLPQFYNIPPGSYILTVVPCKAAFNDTHPTPMPVTMPVNIIAGIKGGQNLYIYPFTVDLESYTFSIAGESPFAESSYSDLTHDEETNTLSVDLSTETNYDWWGYFVLPDTATVTDVALSYADFGRILYEQEDYTINHVDGYNIVVVRIDPGAQQLILHYAPVPQP